MKSRNKKIKILTLIVLVFAAIIFSYEYFYLPKDLNIFVNSGISLSYPKGWFSKEDDVLGQPGWDFGTSTVVMHLSVGPKDLGKLSLRAPLDQRTSLRKALSYELKNIEEIPMGEISGFRGISYNPTLSWSEEEIWVQSDEHTYVISYQKEDEKIVEQIIHSLKFVKN